MFSEKLDSPITGDSDAARHTGWFKTFSGTFILVRIDFGTILGFFEPFFKNFSFYFLSWRVEDQFFDREALQAVSGCSLAKVSQ